MNSIVLSNFEKFKHTVIDVSVLLLDLDDTLIRTRDHYREAFESFMEFMERIGFSRSEVTPVFDQIEMKNNELMGVSPDRYPTSMEMTYKTLCLDSGKEPDNKIIDDILDFGWKINRAKYSLMSGAKEVISKLHDKYRLILVTRGEEKLQKRKIHESGLEQYFSSYHILSKKNTEAFRSIIIREKLNPDITAVIGDSIPADINPALELGMKAIFIPYHLSGYSWPYEDNVNPGKDGFIKLDSLRELIPLLFNGK